VRFGRGVRERALPADPLTGHALAKEEVGIMVTRRQLLAGSVAGATALIPFALHRSPVAAHHLMAGPVPGGTLDPTTIPKYVTPLFILPAMPQARAVFGVDYYEVGVRQIRQQVLPPGSPLTTVFAYGAVANAATFHFPSYTIEARVNRPVRVSWANQLVTAAGDFRPHLLPVDPTLHWANPPGGLAGRDMRPDFDSTPGPYTGPVPVVTHLHGSHVTEESDGYPEAWYLANARNIPAGFAGVGSFYDRYRDEARGRFGVFWPRGASIYQYANDQAATGLWFHDHSLGITRVNIYAGLSGHYLLRGGFADLPAGVLPGPAPRVGDPSGTRYREIPLIIQDRSFNSDGSLFFPSSRDFFGDVPAGGPYLPDSDVSPIWNPEFFGNTTVVNGQTWPALAVEARRYRFRLLNACNTRVLSLKVVSNPLATRPATAALPIWVIGGDGGYLPAPVALNSVQLAVAERADVIVDFSRVRPGTQLYLINEGPDEPFGGGEPETDFAAADPGTTGQVMKFVVTSPTSADTSVPPDRLALPAPRPLATVTNTRRLSLNEIASAVFADAPAEAMLGTVAADGTGVPTPWMAAVTETPRLGSTEVWELNNFTEDAHPIHVHQVQFQVLDRRPFGGPARPGEPAESGRKDTVVALPGETTRIKAHFDIAGRYVWHCHILDHEDNEMMRPFQVG
jgi:bilirubin oxidase